MSTSDGTASDEGGPNHKPGNPTAGALRGAHVLPSHDGGGVVFPAGFYGPGFRLDDWEFIRFFSRATHVEATAQPSSGRWRPPPWFWRNRWIFLGLGLGFGTSQLNRSGLVGISTGQIASALVIWFGFFFYWGMWKAFVRLPRRMRELYPSATELPFFAYWHQHIIAALVTCPAKSYFRPLALVVLEAVFAAAVLIVFARDQLSVALIIAVAPAFAVRVGYTLAILAALAVCRLRHGRAPTTADLEPI